MVATNANHQAFHMYVSVLLTIMKTQTENNKNKQGEDTDS